MPDCTPDRDPCDVLPLSGKGNLKLKITFKNITDKKSKYYASITVGINDKAVKKVKCNMTVKAGKSKSKVYTIKKNLKGLDLTEVCYMNTFIMG